MSELMTVKEFATAAGVSSQRIYQRLDTNLKPFVKVVNGQKRISAEGLQLFEIKPLEQDLNKPLQTLDLLQAENETLKAENAELNSKIKPLEQALEKEREQSAKMTVENAALNEKIKGLEQDLAKTLQPLEKQLDDLRADKQYLQERLTAAEQERLELKAERDSITKERQTILAELLELRKPKIIELKAPAAASETSRTTSEQRPAQRNRSAQQQPTKKESSFLSFIKNKFQRKQ